MPTLIEVNQQPMSAIWLGLQHTENKYRIKYFPLIEKAVKNGDLSKEQYALMKDRILMDEGIDRLIDSRHITHEMFGNFIYRPSTDHSTTQVLTRKGNDVS